MDDKKESYGPKAIGCVCARHMELPRNFVGAFLEPYGPRPWGGFYDLKEPYGPKAIGFPLCILRVECHLRGYKKEIMC